jgi:hypothetical protein
MPFGQDDWPTPRAYLEPATRTWTWSYNLNLIGQDKLPVGEQVYATSLPLPPIDRTFISALNLSLLQPPIRLPFNQYDWPLPGAWAAPYRDYTSYGLPNPNLFPPFVPPVDNTIEVRAPHFTPPRAPLRFDYDIPPNLTVRFAAPPAQNPFYQTDWQINLGPIQPPRSWTWSYNLNLIGQDKLPVGDQVTDLSPKGYPEPATRTWVWSYNLNLIGKDRLPTGDQLYDLSPTGPIQTPFRSWTWSYNLNLIGKDQLPIGDQSYDLSPKGYQEPATRTWTQWYNLNLIGQDKLPAGRQIYELPQPPIYPQQTRTWTWSYNLNLIGQDILPIGEQLSDLPPTGYTYPNDNRTWINRLNLALVVAAAQLPENQYDWPNPKAPLQPANGWTWSYNLNLIGKDQLPVGAQSTALPPTAAPYYNNNRGWINAVNLALTTRTYPFNQYDWPTTGEWRTRQRLPAQSWTASFPLNLIGKDKLPTGKQSYDLPPLGALPILSNRTWALGLNLPIIIKPAKLPFNQSDWPLPGAYAAAYYQRNRSFNPPYNPNLYPVPPPIPIFVAPERPWVRDYWDCDEWGNLYPGSGIRRG